MTTIQAYNACTCTVQHQHIPPGEPGKTWNNWVSGIAQPSAMKCPTVYFPFASFLTSIAGLAGCRYIAFSPHHCCVRSTLKQFTEAVAVALDRAAGFILGIRSASHAFSLDSRGTRTDLPCKVPSLDANRPERLRAKHPLWRPLEVMYSPVPRL